MPSFCPDCLAAAAQDLDFSEWAVAHGLGFDINAAWRKSGAYYWTAEAGDLLRLDPPRLATGARFPPKEAAQHVEIRDLLAAKTCRYYAAYCDGVPPAHSLAVRNCNCEA